MKSNYIISYFNILGNFSYPCPIDTPSSWEDALINGNDGGLNEHGKNFVCRYLSFLDRDVVSPGNYFYRYSMFYEFAISIICDPYKLLFPMSNDINFHFSVLSKRRRSYKSS